MLLFLLVFEFKCHDGSRSIPQEYLNDNVADCDDGSDEPLTPLFSDRDFYCKNEGFVPKTIKRWSIGDGVCDCCDGSDEWITNSTKCKNTCAEENLTYTRELEYLRSHYRNVLADEPKTLTRTYMPIITNEQRSAFYELVRKKPNKHHEYMRYTFDEKKSVRFNGQTIGIFIRQDKNKQFYGNGRYCWENRKTSTVEIELMCWDSTKISYIIEEDICRYTGVYFTPDACTKEDMNKSPDSVNRIMRFLGQ